MYSISYQQEANVEQCYSIGIDTSTDAKVDGITAALCDYSCSFVGKIKADASDKEQSIVVFTPTTNKSITAGVCHTLRSA